MYAGEEYGSAGAYAGANMTNNPISSVTGLATEHAAAIVVLGSLAALIAFRRGFLPASTGTLTGGLVR